MIDAAMIFAAGFGTRMGALTQHKPKPLIPVAGRPLIDHTLRLTEEAGVQRVVINTHYLATKMAEHLASRDVLISHETPQILDTGGGLKAAMPLLEAEVAFALNSDVIWIGPNPLTLLRALWQPEDMDALLMCVPLDQTRGRQGGGDFDVQSDGRIARGGDLVYGGVQILKTRLVTSISDPVFSLNRVWDQANAKGRLHLARYPGQWCDVGRPENIATAEQALEAANV